MNGLPLNIFSSGGGGGDVSYHSNATTAPLFQTENNKPHHHKGIAGAKYQKGNMKMIIIVSNRKTKSKQTNKQNIRTTPHYIKR
jgi:hypothetical protein